VELIGEARSDTARPLLTELLADQNESIRDWARRGLALLGGKKSRD
jgi:HEAT repeat protein